MQGEQISGTSRGNNKRSSSSIFNSSSARRDDDSIVSMSLDEALEANRMGLFQYRLFLLCGLAFMCDALQVGLLSFIGTCAGDEWGLSDRERASITGIVFIGTVLGSMFWGQFAEIYGRKLAFLLVCIVITVGGMLSGQPPLTVDGFVNLY